MQVGFAAAVGDHIDLVSLADGFGQCQTGWEFLTKCEQVALPLFQCLDIFRKGARSGGRRWLGGARRVIKRADVSRWNVFSVVQMINMFLGASSFNRDLALWDVSNAESMRGLFQEATSFDQDISQWQVSSVTDMSFFLCTCARVQSQSRELGRLECRGHVCDVL